MLSRRDLIISTAALASAAALLPLPATAQSGKRLGTVGMVKPTRRPGTLEEIIPFLPPGVGMIPVYLDIKAGTENEFATTLPAYDREVALLADQHCDVMSIEGAPVFMIAGRARETALISNWEKRYGVPMFTAPQNQVNALHALGANSFIGATYFPNALNALYATYFKDWGFDVQSLEGISDVAFDQVQTIAPERVADYIRASYAKHPSAQAIYMLGSGWRVTSIIEPLERELGIPVVHPVVARAWEIQKRLRLYQPVPGFGRLLATLP